jgi:hypothetical protein
MRCEALMLEARFEALAEERRNGDADDEPTDRNGRAQRAP